MHGQFTNPRGIAIDSQGLVYVTEWGNHRVQKFTPNKKFVAQFGSYGSCPGQLNCPHGIAIDTAGTGLVYVSEGGNHRVSVFTSDGAFFSTFEGYYNIPIGLKFDKNGLFYVCNYGINQIVIY